MVALVILSTLARLAALAWSVVLWARLRDWRLGLLTALLAGLTLWQGISFWDIATKDAVGTTEYVAQAFALIASFAAIACVYGLSTMFAERDAATATARDERARVQHEYAELRAIYDNAPVGMATVDTALRFTAVNERLARITGRTVEEHLGRTVREVFPDLADTLEPIFLRVLETGEPSFNLALNGISAAGGGDPRDWSVTHYPIRDGQGRVVAVGCTVADVTDLNWTMRELRASEQRQRALLQAVPDAMFRMAADGTYLAYHALDETRLLVPPDRFLGRTAEEVLPPHLARLCMDAIRRTLQTGRMQTYEYEHALPGQPTTTWEVRMVVSGPEEVLALVRDVTERRKADLALRASEERHRAIIETTRTGYVVLDSDGRVVDANPEYVRLSGHQSFQDIAGRRVTEWTAPHDLDRNAAAIRRCFTEGRTTDLEIDYIRPTGGVQPVEINATVLTTPDGPRIFGLCRDISDRRAAAAALRESEHQLRQIIAAIPQLVWACDPDGSNQTFNIRWEEYVGRSLDGTNGDEWLEAVHPDDRARARDAWIAAAAEGRPFQSEYRIRRASDGQYRWHLDRGVPLRDESGRIVRWFGTCTDIHDLRTAQEEVARSREELERAQAVAHIGSWTSEMVPDGRLTWSAETCRIFGIPPDRFDGRVGTFFQSTHPDDVAVVQAALRDAIDAGRPYDVEHRIVRPDGEIRWVHEHADVVRDEDGQVVKLIGTVQDVTERRLAEERLRASEERYRLLFELNPQPMWVFDRETLRFLAVNQAAIRLYGFSEDEFRNMTIRDLAPPDDPDAAPVPESGGHTRHRTRSGETIDAEVFAHAIDFQGRPAMLVAANDVTARVRAEDRVRASEARFRRVVDSNMIGIHFWTIDGTVTDANDRFLDLVGYTRDDLLAGRLTWNGITPPEHAHFDTRALDEIARTGICTPFEKEYIRKDGSRLPVLLGAARLDAEGREGVCFVVDLTEQKLAEEQRLAAEQRYRALFEQSPDGIAVVDPDTGAVLEANRSLRRMLGCSPQDLAAFEEPAGARLAAPQIRRLVHQRSVSFETRLRSRTGALLIAAVTAQVIEVQGHQRLHLIIRDVTEARQAAEKLRDAEQRNTLLVRQTPLAVIVWDTGGHVVEWNPTAERLFGYTAAEAHGRHFHELIVPSPIRPHVAGIWRALIEQSGGSRSTNDNVTKDGRIITCEWYNTPLVDAQGRLIGVASLVQDITERRRLEEELRRAQKMEAIGQLASGVAHDFSNLLTAIFGFTNLARRTLSPQHPAVRSLDRVDEAARQAAGVSRALLTFSRGGISEKKPVRLSQVVDDALRILRRTFPTSIQITTTTPRKPVWVRADATQLQQVLMNLAINARDAMPNGGHLSIAVAEGPAIPAADGDGEPRGTSRSAVLSVADTGTGMTPEVCARVFEPFFTTKPPGQGTGLGLPIVHGIVKDHGGRIDVHSEPGRGSTFTVLLPAIDPEPESPPGRAASFPAGRGRLLILADAHRFTREIIASMLEASGFEVVQASSSDALLDALERHSQRAAAVVLDADLCTMSGTSYAATIRAKNPDIKIIAITAPDRRVAEDFKDATVLAKPFQMSDLSAAVSAALG